MKKSQLSQFRKNTFLLLMAASSTFLVGAANAQVKGSEAVKKMEEHYRGLAETNKVFMDQQVMVDAIETYQKQIIAVERTMPVDTAVIEGLKKSKRDKEKELSEYRNKVNRAQYVRKGEPKNKDGQTTASGMAAPASAKPNVASKAQQLPARNAAPTTAAPGSTPENGDKAPARPIGRLSKEALSVLDGVQLGGNRQGSGENPEMGKATPGSRPVPRANTSSSAAPQVLAELFAKKKAAMDAAGGAVPPPPPVARAATPAQAIPATPALATQHVVLGANDSLHMEEGQSPGPQASLVVTNHLGNTHGVLVEEDKLVLSGGLHSTNLRLDDNGAMFSEVGSGAAVVVGGVADGIAPTDAANVGQLHRVVDAAVTPLGARLDGLESRVQQLDQKINAVEKKLSGGVAMALALSQPVSFAPKSNSAVTGGVATYNGQTAMGFSFNRLLTNTETRRTLVSMGVAATTSGRSSASARAGASFSW